MNHNFDCPAWGGGQCTCPQPTTYISGNTNECPHGQLARQCPICERDAEIARLRGALTNIQAACMNDRLFRLFSEQKFWHAHHVDIVWRFDGKDERAEADWLKTVWYELRAALAKEG